MTTPKWRRVALYARVSTDEQSVDQQLSALRRWVEGRADEVTEYADTGSTRKERPGLERLLKAARHGEIDAVVVWAFDRVARSARELIMFFDELRERRIDFLSHTQGIDSSTSMGRFVFNIFASIAEIERDMISERTRARLSYLRARGVKLGRPRIKVDMKRARRLVVDGGLSTRQLARALGIKKSKAAEVWRECRPKKGAPGSAGLGKAQS